MKRFYFYSILLIGIAPRIAQYFLNRSLWFDESLLALNILDRDWLSLLKPLESQQVAPILFLLLEKMMVTLFDGSEFVLRLIPLSSGIASIFLIYRYTKQVSGNEMAALIAMFIFSTSHVIITYSTEVKQYETDIFSAISLLAFSFDSYLVNKGKWRYVWMCIGGVVLIFLSNITILVMLSILLFFLVKYKWCIFNKKSLIIVFFFWGAFFLIIILFSFISIQVNLIWLNTGVITMHLCLYIFSRLPFGFIKSLFLSSTRFTHYRSLLFICSVL